MVMMESIGLAPQEVGNDDESQTIRLRTARDSPGEFVMVRLSSSLIVTDAWAWEEVITVRCGANCRSAQRRASPSLWTREVSSDGSRTSLAPAANITSTARAAA